MAGGGRAGVDWMRSVSCPSVRLCVSVSTTRIASSTRPAQGGRTWAVSALRSPLVGGATVGCARSLCVAGDQRDDLLVSRTPARGARAWHTFNLGQGYNTLESISCPAADLCIAGDYQGNVLSSTNPTDAASWSVRSLGTPPGYWYPLLSLSCASQNLCAGTSVLDVLTSTAPTGGGAAWSVAALPYPGVTAISCPSANLCAAGGVDGSVLTTTDPTGGAGAWTSQQLGVAPYDCDKYGCTYDSITAVSCASQKLCGATDGYDLWVSTDPGADGATWVESQLPSTSSTLACPADDLCVGAGAAEIYATTDPSDASPTWTVTQLPKITNPAPSGTSMLASVSSVSCLSRQLCVAIDESAGYAFAGNPTDPNSWTATRIEPPLPGPHQSPVAAVTGVSCAPAGPCIAVDTAGAIIIGRVSG